jgi:hydroxymethylpyrimidine/phosphomethylpyrimidine kinase
MMEPNGGDQFRISGGIQGTRLGRGLDHPPERGIICPMSIEFSSPPVALTIAGSDCSAGAGLQADLKTFSALGVHGLTAVTCVVSETARVVEEVFPLPPALVAGQVSLLARSFPLGAVKTGMLFSAPHIEAVVEALSGLACPLVVDPVMMASTGDPLIEPAAIDLYRRVLLPRATLATPNLDEASVLLDGRNIERPSLAATAVELAERYGTAFLLKGGHLRDGRATDILAHPGCGRVETFETDFIEGVTTHGTGCTYSAAIAAGLAKGLPIRGAVAAAKEFITTAIARSLAWTGSTGRIEALNQSPGTVG